MRTTNIFNKFVSLFTLAAIIFPLSSVAIAATAPSNGEITVVGQVTVNGSAAVSGSTLKSGSVIATGAGSSATLNLGKIGRVEVLANSSLTLNFSSASITGTMASGKARVMTSAGVAATIATKDATVIADSSQSNTFIVEIECAHTHIDTVAGLVTSRSGSQDKQVAAGMNSVAGNASQTGCQPCYRPDNSALPVASIGSFPIAAILALVGGTIGTAILIGTRKDNDATGTAVVVSPVR